MKPYTPQAKQLHLEICDRADKGETLLNLLREYDMTRFMFYHVYRRTRGVAWSVAHPREIPRPGSGTTPSGYSKYAHLIRDGQWHGTNKQLLAYLDDLERHL